MINFIYNLKQSIVVTSFCGLSFLLFGCKTTSYEEVGNNKYFLKAWGSAKSSDEMLKSKIRQQAVELCGENQFTLGDNTYAGENKLGAGASVQGNTAEVPGGETKVLRQFVECHSKNAK